MKNLLQVGSNQITTCVVNIVVNSIVIWGDLEVGILHMIVPERQQVLQQNKPIESPRLKDKNRRKWYLLMIMVESVSGGMQQMQRINVTRI